MTLKKIIRKPFTYVSWNITYIMIGLNILVFMIQRIFPFLTSYLSLNVINVVKNKMYWQFITYFFVHNPTDLSHLFFNMLGLFFFGISVEKIIGSKEFLLLYLTSGIFGGIISFLIYYFTKSWYVFLMGASGVLFTMLFSFAVIRPRDKIYIFAILPIPAPLLVIIYAGIEIASQLLNYKSDIAHLTHLAGFIYAWLYFVLRIGVNPWRIWKDTFN